MMEGTLSKWTNVMKGWQYRYFVLDDNAGLFSYYTSKEKMLRGARRGCVRLRGALIGIDDEDDATFTVTVDGKTFHFQAQNWDERERWIRALEDSVLRHNQTRRSCVRRYGSGRLAGANGQQHRSAGGSVGSGGGVVLPGDAVPTVEDFEKKLSETDSYLQLLLKQIGGLTLKMEDDEGQSCNNAAAAADQGDGEGEGSGEDKDRRRQAEGLSRRSKYEEIAGKAVEVTESIKHAIVLLQIAKNASAPHVELPIKQYRTIIRPDQGIEVGPLHGVANSLGTAASTPSTPPANGKNHYQPDANKKLVSDKISVRQQQQQPVDELRGGKHLQQSNRHRRSSATAASCADDENDLQPTLKPTLETQLQQHQHQLQLQQKHASKKDPVSVKTNIPVTVIQAAGAAASAAGKSAAVHLQVSVSPHSIPETSYSSSDDDDDFFDAAEYEEDIEDEAVSCNNTDDAVFNVSSSDSGGPAVVGGMLRSPLESTNMGGKSMGGGGGDASGTDLEDGVDYDALYEGDGGSDQDVDMKSHGSVITHLLSQVRIGMDLTKIVLPTFILERRSLLEMYSDFFAHPDLFLSIPDGPTAEERMVRVLRWYLSSFHAGRKSSIAKKPYNPILGETFRCRWEGVRSTTPAGPQPTTKPTNLAENVQKKCREFPNCSPDDLVFIAEQVSHHPPVSAFYAEHVKKRVSAIGHIYTKSSFLGMSVAVHNIGRGTISLLDHGEEYVLTFPSGFGRSILTVPWVELGGKVTIECAQTGYSAEIEFKCKQFFSSDVNKISADVFAPNSKKSLVRVEGEWNGKMVAKWSHPSKQEVFIDVSNIPLHPKLCKPVREQGFFESRRLWKNVTYNLKYDNIEAATASKFALEQRQREEAAERKESGTKWIPKLFTSNGNDLTSCLWQYNDTLKDRLC